MMHTAALMLTTLVLLTGCAATQPSHSASAQSTPPPYVQCVATLVDLEPDYPWFENWVEDDGTEVHGDGSSPRAVFKITSPHNYAKRKVGVLYKYEGSDLPVPPSVSQKGTVFSFELPEDFFTGKYETIDNIHVERLRAMP
jgi:hypothetical protein